MYSAFIVLGTGIILRPPRSLVQVMMVGQTLNGVLLPVILVVMLRLINDRRLMGNFANEWVFNALAWVIVVALIALTVILLITTFFSNFLSSG